MVEDVDVVAITTMPSPLSKSGMAVLEGCKEINSRLEKFKLANPGGTWEEWVTAAFFAR